MAMSVGLIYHQETKCMLSVCFYQGKL